MAYSDEYITRRREWWIECSKLVTSANYKEAVKFSKKGMKLFPNDVVVEFRHYALICDYLLSSKRSLSPRYKANVLKMKKCLRRLKGQPSWAKSYMKNEYYYMTKQYKKQYQLGVDEYKKTKDFEELYSAGVGAANYALELAKKKQISKAMAWAEKSISSWEQYFEYESDYYNPYVHYALAWGILGRLDKMSTALTLAQMKSGKGENYSEFIWVRKEIAALIKSKKK